MTVGVKVMVLYHLMVIILQNELYLIGVGEQSIIHLTMVLDHPIQMTVLSLCPGIKYVFCY